MKNFNNLNFLNKVKYICTLSSKSVEFSFQKWNQWDQCI